MELEFEAQKNHIRDTFGVEKKRGGVHLVNGLEEVGEGFIDVSRKGFIVVRQEIMHVVILLWVGVGSRMAATCRRMSALVFCESVAREVARRVWE